jgi:hypothetical protein
MVRRRAKRNQRFDGRLRCVCGSFAPRFGCTAIVAAVQRPLVASLVLFLGAGLLAGPTAARRAHDTPTKLTAVARVYSLGVGEVRCASSLEWNADFASSFGWAYTNLRDEYVVLGPLVCEGALNVGSPEVPAWQQALGSLVVVHEAFHLRRWRYRRNEGKVECQALVYFTDAARRLGATAAQADELYPYALALDAYQVRLFPRYRDRSCVIPPWVPPTVDANARQEGERAQ